MCLLQCVIRALCMCDPVKLGDWSNFPHEFFILQSNTVSLLSDKPINYEALREQLRIHEAKSGVFGCVDPPVEKSRE